MNEHRGPLVTMAFGFFPAQTIHLAARLELPDHLAEGPRTTAELAAATGTHEPSLYRLLRALVLFEVVTEPEAGRFELTDRGQLLRADNPESVRNLFLLFCGNEVWRSWGDLEHSVRTGETSWGRLFGPPFEYLSEHPELNAIFNEAMAEGTRAAAPGVAAYDFSRFTGVVDIGGGNGTLLTTVLDAHPDLKGTLFDTAAGLEDAPAVVGASDAADRCQIVSGDFFVSVPDGMDAYLLKSVIHDWNDEQCVEILRNCRTAMAGDGRVLIVEVVVPERVQPQSEAWGMLMSDLNMLVCAGGRERTAAEFEQILADSGLELVSITPLPSPTNYSVIEAKPTQ